MLSMSFIIFLPRNKCLLISWLQSPSAVILEPRKKKVCHCFHCFHIYLPWSDGNGCHDLFKEAFSCSSFTFIKRLFSTFSLSAIRVVSSAYLKLSTFSPELLISACASSNPPFCMMYTACKLNKQGDNRQPWHTLFPILNQSSVPCPVLTVATWPAYRFHRTQVRWSGNSTSWRVFHSFLWSTQSKALV